MRRFLCATVLSFQFALNFPSTVSGEVFSKGTYKPPQSSSLSVGFSRERNAPRFRVVTLSDRNLNGTPRFYTMLCVENLSRKQGTKVFLRNLVQEDELNELHVSTDGVVRDKSNLVNVTTLDNLSRGEPICFRVVNSSGDEASVMHVPIPLINWDDKGHSIEVVQMDPMANELFTVYLDGYKPGEKLVCRSCSEGELIEYERTFQPNCSDGRMCSTHSPGVIGKEKGSCTITIRGESHELDITFDWGVGSRTVCSWNDWTQWKREHGIDSFTDPSTLPCGAMAAYFQLKTQGGL